MSHYYQPIPKILVTCEECGKQFLGHSKLKYCPDGICADNARARKMKEKYHAENTEKIILPRPCKARDCGKIFTPPYKDSQDYCCRKCQKKEADRRKRDAIRNASQTTRENEARAAEAQPKPASDKMPTWRVKVLKIHRPELLECDRRYNYVPVLGIS